MKLNTDALIDHPKLLLRSFPRVSKVIGRQKSAVFAAFRIISLLDHQMQVLLAP
jgi:hypothetical protein